MRRREDKRIIPLILLTVIFWVGLLGIIFWVDPIILKDFIVYNSYLGFFIVFFIAWFFLLTLILNNTRRGLLYGFGITLLVILRLLRLGNVINLVLILSVVVVVDFYFSNR